MVVFEFKFEFIFELYWLVLDLGEYIVRDDGLFVIVGCGFERDVS